jgi:hypothetical protein
MALDETNADRNVDSGAACPDQRLGRDEPIALFEAIGVWCEFLQAASESSLPSERLQYWLPRADRPLATTVVAEAAFTSRSA